jgi:hypothetical protein
MAGSTAPARTAPPERAVATRVIAELLDHYDPVIARLLAGTSTSSATLRRHSFNATRKPCSARRCVARK